MALLAFDLSSRLYLHVKNVLGHYDFRHVENTSRNPVIKKQKTKGIYCIMRNVTESAKSWINKSNVGQKKRNLGENKWISLGPTSCIHSFTLILDINKTYLQSNKLINQ